MIPVTQTKVVIKNSKGETVVNGNCWAAAIASILELPITEVPNFEVWFKFDNTTWSELVDLYLKKMGYEWEGYAPHFKVFHHDLCHEYFKETAGQYPDGLPYEQWKEKLRVELNDQYYFICGPSARGVNHVTIWQNGKMVHDPHPTGEGIVELKRFEQIKKIEIK